MASKKKANGGNPAQRATTNALQRPKLASGEVYVGAVIGANGKGHHVILLPGDESGTWADMMASAKKQGGDLPDRVEQALLYRDHKDKFEKRYYWSNTQYADVSDFAWGQYFGYGNQIAGDVSYAYRARAVRRVPIQ